VELKNSNLVSGSADNSIKLWDLNSNKCVLTLNEHDSYIIGIKELEYYNSGDSGYFLSFSGDFTIKLFKFKKIS
jgi:WD40 repeat protein